LRDLRRYSRRHRYDARGPTSPRIIQGVLNARYHGGSSLYGVARHKHTVHLHNPLRQRLLVPAPKDSLYPGIIALTVDASNMTQDIIVVHETIPVAKGGTLTLLYPEWRPGNHSPTARTRIGRVAGLVVSVKGKPVAWTRDPVNVYAFHLPLPAEGHFGDVDFQYLAPTSGDYGRQENDDQHPDARLGWRWCSIRQATTARQIRIEPRLVVPAGWQMATALERVL